MTAPTLPRETTCKGSNHTPDCEHFPARVPETLQQLEVRLIAVGANVRPDPGDLDDLAASIQQRGVLSPVKVEPVGDGTYVLTYGQRRLAAAKLAGLDRIPAIVAGADGLAEPGAKRSIEQLVENLHRADLNPVDRAKAMRDVVDAGMSQADLARELGLASSTIANDLGILDAPPAVLAHLAAGRLTASHAKAMKGLAPSTQKELAATAIAHGRSAHGLEEDVREHKRSEQWRKEQQERERKTSQKIAEVDRLAIETKLAKVPKDAEIHVPNPYYGSSDTRRAAIAKLLAEAGFTNVKVGTKDVDSRPAALGCDCKAWKVEPQYERLLIGPACVKPAHVRAKQKAADDKRQEKYALEGRVKARLRELGPNLASTLVGGQGIGLDPLLARMALWDSLGYGVADWAEKRGGLRTRPWPTIAALSEAELAVELGTSLARAFSDQFGYHLPWDQLAAELDIAEEPKPEPKAKLPRRKPPVEAAPK